MSVRRRGKRLVIDYYPDGKYGKRVRRTLGENYDEEDARLIEEDLLRAARAPEEISLPTGITVTEAFPSYIAWYQLHRSKSSHEDLQWTWEAHIKRILGEYRVDEIGPHHITLYKRIRKTEGVRPKKKKGAGAAAEEKKELRMVSNRTVNKELSQFSGFLTWCEEYHKIKRGDFRIQPLPYKRPVPMPLSFDECMRIIEAAEPLYRAYIICLFVLGLRKAEARNIRKSDIDRANHTIKVVQKGGSEKVLPAGKWLTSILDKISSDEPQYLRRARDPARRDIPVENPHEYIFFNRRTGKPIQNYRKALERAVKEAGVSKRVTPHIFRHSIGKFLVDENINLRIIQKYLGHQRVSTTEIYTQVELHSLREAENVILKSMAKFYKRKRNKGSVTTKK